jgi:hypothetical protein
VKPSIQMAKDRIQTEFRHRQELSGETIAVGPTALA